MIRHLISFYAFCSVYLYQSYLICHKAFRCWLNLSILRFLWGKLRYLHNHPIYPYRCLPRTVINNATSAATISIRTLTGTDAAGGGARCTQGDFNNPRYPKGQALRSRLDTGSLFGGLIIPHSVWEDVSWLSLSAHPHSGSHPFSGGFR